jgi:6-phosphogluconolactonase (cycloisomerase 2 family)
MHIRSLGLLAKVLSVSALLLVLAACGTNPTNSQITNTCGGCSFLYATTNANQILSFELDSSGTLGAPVSTPAVANSPDLTGLGGLGGLYPPGGPLYVSDPNGNDVDAFVVSGNGALTPMTGSPFGLGGSSTGTPAALLTFGNFLYVGDTNGTITAFNIASGGALTAISGSPIAAGFAPVNLVSAYTNPPNGPSFPLLYAADFSGGGIWGFTIGSDGSLTAIPGSPFATPANSAPSQMFVGASVNSGGVLYVALSGLNEIGAFAISASGSLTPLAGSPFAAGRGPGSLFGFTNFLYALNSLDHTISAYSMDQNSGVLNEISGSPFAAGTADQGLINNTLDSAIFYVPDLHSSNILGFVADNTTGSLAPLAGSPFSTGVGPVALTTVGFPAMDPP